MKTPHYIFILCLLCLMGLTTQNLKAEESETTEFSDKPKVTFGGTVRYNYIYKDWDKASEKTLGTIAQDIFALKVSATYKRFYCNAEYRWFAIDNGYGMLRDGYMGYVIDQHQNIQLGLLRAPFGILPFTTYDWYFGMNFFIGLEDDADYGVNYIYDTEHWTFNAAFFKNSDLQGGSTNRYSIDMIGHDRETNQLNLRGVYRFGTTAKSTLGASMMAGQIYNQTSQNMGKRIAYALHYELTYNHWDAKLQYTGYEYTHATGSLQDDFFVMGSGGSYFSMANKGSTLTASLAYTFPIDGEYVDNIQIYNDYSCLMKDNSGYNTSVINTAGVCVSAGPIIVYLDNVFGYNMPFLGGNTGIYQNPSFQYDGTELGVSDGFVQGADETWRYRLNLNIGYYF